jgi:DNA (cytosine-5)-methyltransferase 3A
MNVLSLFDGMSCGQLALERAGISPTNYFASEIKPHAIDITMANYPNTVQLGDIATLDANALPKIDLLIGGSPCQDLSQAHSTRAGLRGEKSRLFFEYVRVLKDTAPTYFLLENVLMKRDQADIISSALGVAPIVIDSQLVSAQLRRRMYWTNIPDVSQPKDKGIVLQGILDDGYTNRTKSRCLLASDSRPLSSRPKMYHRYAKFNTIVFKDAAHYAACKAHYDTYDKGKSAKEIDAVEGVDNSVYAGIRHLNKAERARLQTVPEEYMGDISENEAACLLGDGWTVDVIAHIFKGVA